MKALDKNLRIYEKGRSNYLTGDTTIPTKLQNQTALVDS